MQADAFVATERHSGTLAGIDPHGEEAAEGMARLVVGTQGRDFLYGGDLADTLYAAGGRQSLTGGRGGDTFVFDFDYIKGKGNTATITDFDPREDELQFVGAHTKIIEVSDHHGGTLLMVNGETIHLLGVKTTDVHAHDHFMV